MTPTAIGSLTAAQQKPDAASTTGHTPEQQKAARDFEAIFLRQLMSSLEKGGGLGGQSSGGQVFRSMMVSALADTASEGGGIGLSELILKAMLPPNPQAQPGEAAGPVGGGAARSEASSRVSTKAPPAPMLEDGATGPAAAASSSAPSSSAAPGSAASSSEGNGR